MSDHGADGNEITAEKEREESIERKLVRAVAKEMTFRDKGIRGKVFHETDVAPIVFATIHCIAQLGWRIYKNAVICRECRRTVLEPLQAFAEKVIAEATEKSAKMIAQAKDQASLFNASKD